MLIQKLRKASPLTNRLITGCSSLLRGLSTAPETTKNNAGYREQIDKNTLYKALSSVGPTNPVTNVLYKLTRDGKQFYKSDLIYCVKSLRKSRRYHHCLQILEWMEKGTQNCSERDLALHLGVIYNLRGIEEAEKFFDGLSPDMKSHSTYGALLNCYCTEKMVDKALSLFEEMDKMSYTNDLAYNNIMGLFMKLEQPEKVPPLVQDMKKKNITLSNYSYCIWLQSYGCVNDLEGVERVMDEVQEQSLLKNDWSIYSNLTALFIKANQLEKAVETLKKLEEVLDNMPYPNREAYRYLISFCGSTGDRGLLTRVWAKLKSRPKFCNNHIYLTMLNALSKLDDMDGLKKCFKEWELSCQNQKYDARLPVVVIGAYLKRDMGEEAEQLLKDATNSYGQKIWNAHISFANYYLGKHQIGSAMKHMELVVTHRGKNFTDAVNSFFDYFQEVKDVDGAEEFCRILKKGQRLDLNAYLRLLQTYAAAGKTAPLELRQRMEQDGVDIGTEHEELVEKVCVD